MKENIPEINSESMITAKFAIKRGRQLIQADLTLNPGLTAIIGPNGAGKSTLLAALAGLRLLEPQSKVEVFGRELDDYSKGQLASKIAFLPAQNDVPFPLTISELIDLGQPTPQAKATAMAQMELNELQFVPLLELSTGEAKRAWLAFALARRTPILLLDEPLSGLDPRYQMRLLAVLQKRAQSCTVVFVAHDLPYSAKADRVIAVNNGQVVADGAPQIVLKPELLEQIFGVEVYLFNEEDVIFPLPKRAL